MVKCFLYCAWVGSEFDESGDILKCPWSLACLSHFTEGCPESLSLCLSRLTNTSYLVREGHRTQHNNCNVKHFTLDITQVHHHAAALFIAITDQWRIEINALPVYYRVDQKKCPTLSESSGISLQIQDDFSIKWGIFFGPPCSRESLAY